jgi:hypothetical protein
MLARDFPVAVVFLFSLSHAARLQPSSNDTQRCSRSRIPSA